MDVLWPSTALRHSFRTVPLNLVSETNELIRANTGYVPTGNIPQVCLHVEAISKLCDAIVEIIRCIIISLLSTLSLIPCIQSVRPQCCSRTSVQQWR